MATAVFELLHSSYYYKADKAHTIFSIVNLFAIVWLVRNLSRTNYN